MVKKTERPRDLKRQRWAAIVAAILAFGMVASVVGGYLGHALGGDGAVMNQQQADPEPEDYLAHYEGEVERLEEHIDEHDPSPSVLRELAENYRYLSLVQQMYFNDMEAVEEYQERLLSIYDTLVELEPDNPRFRLDLINMYEEKGKEEAEIVEEINVVREQLRETPDPMAHFSLITMLDTEDREELFQEEVEWLTGYLESRVVEGTADNEERLYYTYLLGEYLNDQAAAKSMIEEILEDEPEDSWIYREAQNYLNYLQSEEDIEEDLYFD